MMASTFHTSPSVISSTSLRPPPAEPAGIANTADSAPSISVPPRLASVFSMWRASVLIAAGVHTPKPDTISTVEPKRANDTASADVRPAAMPFSARRAEAMLSPPIEPEQSTSSFSAMPSRRGASGTGSVASSTVGASGARASRACVTTAAADSLGVTTSTTSRSSRASGASVTSRPASARWLTTRCVGHSTAASASAPATCSVSASGYSAWIEATGACCGCRPADAGSP